MISILFLLLFFHIINNKQWCSTYFLYIVTSLFTVSPPPHVNNDVSYFKFIMFIIFFGVLFSVAHKSLQHFYYLFHDFFTIVVEEKQHKQTFFFFFYFLQDLQYVVKITCLSAKWYLVCCFFLCVFLFFLFLPTFISFKGSKANIIIK